MNKINSTSPALLGSRLLKWFDANRRDLPWRAREGDLANPYHVWLSEIMLQQTTVPTVIPYFGNFVARWPTVQDLAASDLDDVLHAWQGLGYYARARNLYKCAGVIATEFDGILPDNEETLLKLPGIGAYTAAAVAAIAYQKPSVPVDGNIERVISRMHALEQPAKLIRKKISGLAAEMLPTERPGDFAQAMMDLGSMVCRPKSADCAACPWQSGCTSSATGDWARFPVKLAKPDKPTRKGVAFWLVRDDGAVYLRRRPEKGLLGGMIEIPSTLWREEDWTTEAALGSSPDGANWRQLPGHVKHTFTHFHLLITIVIGTADHTRPNDGYWCKPDEFGDYALPTLMKKIARHAMSEKVQSS
jgi:A/G-specific adenine glycosylase